jgi:hypothetical protein
MIDYVAGVVSRAVDEPRIAPMLEVLTNDVQARCRRDTSLLSDRAVRRQDRHLQPGMVWAVACGDDHRPDVLSGQAQSRHRFGDLNRTRSNGRQDLPVQASCVDVVVHRIEKVMHPPIGFADIVEEIIPERRHRPGHLLESAQQAHSALLQHV